MTRKSRPNLSGLVARAQENVQAIEQSEAQRSPTQYLPVGSLSPSPFQARRDFSSLPGLVEDVRTNGVLQPILVRPIGADRYEIVAGERRWRASQEAGRAHIPAVVRLMSDEQAREFSLRENLQREDLNAYEIATAVLDWTAARLGQAREQVQEDLGLNQPPQQTVSVMNEALTLVNRELTLQSYQRHYLALLRLPPHLLAAIEGGAPYSAVLALRPATPEQQQEWLPKVVSGEWSRRQVQQALKDAKVKPKPRPAKQRPSWSARWTELQTVMNDERQAALDVREQEKVNRLLEELAALLTVRGSQKSKKTIRKQ